MGTIRLFGIDSFNFDEYKLIAEAITVILKDEGELNQLIKRRDNIPTNQPSEVVESEVVKKWKGNHDAAVYVLLLAVADDDQLLWNYLHKVYPKSIVNKDNGTEPYKQNYKRSIWGNAPLPKDDSRIQKLKTSLSKSTLADLKELFTRPDPVLLDFFRGDNAHDPGAYDRLQKIGNIIFHIPITPSSQANFTTNPNGAEKMNLEDEIKNLITGGRIRQIIFTGAPGTGKTYIAKKIAEELGAQLKDGKSYRFVQFHPSYDYTDFVEGLRPVQPNQPGMSGNNNIQFAKLDGIFKKFCREVVELNKVNEEQLYFFIIDEINRADLSKVFGELMYCLEKDKRGADNCVATQYQTLPTCDETGCPISNDVFADGFYIPENVVIIGTMNDIDRSVESMDFALRRRFEWKEFIVDEQLLRNAFTATVTADNGSSEPIYGKLICDHAEQLAGDITRLNDALIAEGKAYGLNRQYFISQGQFANLPDASHISEIMKAEFDQLGADASDQLLAFKSYVWNYRIESLLREYMRGNDEKEIEDFVKECLFAFLPEINAGKDASKEGADEDSEDEGISDDEY